MRFAGRAFAYVTNAAATPSRWSTWRCGSRCATIAMDSGPHGIALSADGAFAYVINAKQQRFVVDLALRQQVATIGVGRYPPALPSRRTALRLRDGNATATASR